MISAARCVAEMSNMLRREKRGRAGESASSIHEVHQKSVLAHAGWWNIGLLILDNPSPLHRWLLPGLCWCVINTSVRSFWPAATKTHRPTHHTTLNIFVSMPTDTHTNIEQQVVCARGERLCMDAHFPSHWDICVLALMTKLAINCAMGETSQRNVMCTTELWPGLSATETQRF